jgi:hypothetical protein
VGSGLLRIGCVARLSRSPTYGTFDMQGAYSLEHMGREDAVLVLHMVPGDAVLVLELGRQAQAVAAVGALQKHVCRRWL